MRARNGRFDRPTGGCPTSSSKRRHILIGRALRSPPRLPFRAPPCRWPRTSARGRSASSVFGRPASWGASSLLLRSRQRLLMVADGGRIHAVGRPLTATLRPSSSGKEGATCPGGPPLWRGCVGDLYAAVAYTRCEDGGNNHESMQRLQGGAYSQLYTPGTRGPTSHQKADSVSSPRGQNRCTVPVRRRWQSPPSLWRDNLST